MLCISDLSIPRVAQEWNERQKDLVVEKLIGELGRDLSPYRIAVWGLAFKPETDDLREAVSLRVIEQLLSHNATVIAHDPQAMDNMKEVFPEDPPRINYMNSVYDAVDGVNASLIVTEWDEFKEIDLGQLKRVMANPIIVDGRNVFDPDIVKEYGFEYYSIGR